MIEKQTWKKVKRFRTDNRIEFYSTKFDQSYKIEGIMRSYSSVHITAEWSCRKNEQDIVEKSSVRILPCFKEEMMVQDNPIKL